ncbi:MAG: amidohydrolase family protein, partial [Anaerolineae bacterium]
MLITNGTVLTFGREKRVIPGGAVYYRDDTIVAVGPTSELRAAYPNAKTLDAEGRLIMPGNICAHTHFYGAFARGMAIPGPPPANFMQILEQLWWKLDRALTLEDCRAGAQVALVDAIRHGTTTLIDHHASPNAIDGSLDALAEATLESGLRVSLCYEVTDRNGPAGAQAGIAENVRWLKKVQTMRRRGDPNAERLGASFGLHASFTVSDQTIDRCLTAAAGLDTGFHIHLAEDKADEQNALQLLNMRTAERLEKRGVLGPKSLVAHGVHLDAFEMNALKTTATKLSHQPRSNMNNAVGVAPVETMLK